MDINEKLANVVNRYNELSSLIAEPNVNADSLVKMNKEMANLAPVVAAIEEYNSIKRSFNEAKEIMEDDSMDKEMKELAENEYYQLKDIIPEKEKAIKILLLPKDVDVIINQK